MKTLTWILKEQNYDVVVAPGGEGLLAMVEEERPHLLLLDIMMPKVDGLQLLERLKRDERFRDLPVLMVSSMPPEEATVKSLGLGAADFISKPFRVKELLARVEAHLRVGQALSQAREEARSRAAMVDILHEVTDSLKPDEIYHILARRVARVLNISRCSMVLAKPGDERGVVVAAYENPMLRNLEIELARYPEIRKAISSGRTVLVEDVRADALYVEERLRWAREGINVPTRSAVAIPFSMRDQQQGVFFLRTTGDDPPLTRADAGFAETVIKTAVAAIEKAYDFESAVSDKQRLERLAATDALTGCLNRRGLSEQLELELDRARRYNLAVSLLLADIDRFKQINDTRGHVAGDSVLRQVGELLRREARSVDIVARYGGEEFVVVMPETALHGAAIFAERLRRRIAARDFADPGEDPLHMTVSIGLAAFPDDRAPGRRDLRRARRPGVVSRQKRGPQPGTRMTERRCPKCGNVYAAGARFCPRGRKHAGGGAGQAGPSRGGRCVRHGRAGTRHPRPSAPAWIWRPRSRARCSTPGIRCRASSAKAGCRTCTSPRRSPPAPPSRSRCSPPSSRPTRAPSSACGARPAWRCASITPTCAASCASASPRTD